MDGGRMARFALLAAGVAVALTVSRAWPRDQTVHYMLGDAASRIRELDAYWGPASVSRASATDGEDWTRKVSFRYAPGTAPRVVTHQPHVADGDYTVEISIVADTDRMTIRRRVRLAGGVTSIDLASLGSSLPGGLP